MPVSIQATFSLHPSFGMDVFNLVYVLKMCLWDKFSADMKRKHIEMLLDDLCIK